MAAALIVPAAGIATAQSAGAVANNVTCTTNTGTLKSDPGVSLTVKHGLTITGTGGVLDGCSGIGISGDATGGTLKFSLRAAPANCKTIKGDVATGGGRITWGDGSNAGIITNLKLKIKFNSFTQVTFSGSVIGKGYLGGAKIGGTATIPPSLRAAGDNEGTCGNSDGSRVKKLDYTNKADFTIGV